MYKRQEAVTWLCSSLAGNTCSERPRCQSGPPCPVLKPLTPQSCTKLAPSIPRKESKVEKSCHSVVQLLSRTHQFRTATVSIGTTLSCFETPPCKFSTTDTPILHQTGSVDRPESRQGTKKLPFDSCSTLAGNNSLEQPRCQSGPHCAVSILLHANSQPLTTQSYTKQVPSTPPESR